MREQNMRRTGGVGD